MSASFERQFEEITSRFTLALVAVALRDCWEDVPSELRETPTCVVLEDDLQCIDSSDDAHPSPGK